MRPFLGSIFGQFNINVPMQGRGYQPKPLDDDENEPVPPNMGSGVKKPKHRQIRLDWSPFRIKTARYEITITEDGRLVVRGEYQFDPRPMGQ